MEPFGFEILDLTRVGSGSFVAPPIPGRSGRTFGGHFMAQALAAAQRAEVGERTVHSLHAYFVRMGAVDESTTYEVSARRDGRSFALRSVTARQRGEVVFEMSASFHAVEDGFEYQPGGRYPIEAVPGPSSDMMTYGQFIDRHPDSEPGGWSGGDRPITIYYINPPEGNEGVPVLEPQLMWVRIDSSVPDIPGAQAAGLAYVSDCTLLDHAVLPHGYRWPDKRLTSASLDHAMWFHRLARADQWLLFDQRVESTGAARGLVTGRLYRRDGVLVATCSQEGLLRWSGS